MGEKKFVWGKIPQDCNLPAKSQKLFLQCIFDAMHFWCDAAPFCCSLSGCRQSKAFWYALLTEVPSIISTRGTGFHPLSGQRTCMYNQHQVWEARALHSMDIKRIQLAGKKYSNKWQNKNDLKHTKKQFPWSQSRLKCKGAFFRYFRKDREETES